MLQLCTSRSAIHTHLSQGCTKYVGFHVFDHEHLACCESDFCEDWIEEQFNQLSDVSDFANDGEDDDDDEYEDDDDGYEDEF